MKKFALPIALAFVFCTSVWADPPEGHLDFPEMPFLSEVAVDNGPDGTLPILFMVDVGSDDVEIVPNFKIRIVNVWMSVEVTDEISYSVKDGFGGNVLTGFNTTTVGIQQMKTLAADFSTIDPAAGESIFIDALPTGTTAEGHIYVMAVRVL